MDNTVPWGTRPKGHTNLTLHIPYIQDIRQELVSSSLTQRLVADFNYILDK